MKGERDIGSSWPWLLLAVLFLRVAHLEAHVHRQQPHRGRAQLRTPQPHRDHIGWQFLRFCRM